MSLLVFSVLILGQTLWASLNAPRPVALEDTALVRRLVGERLGSGPVPAGPWELVPATDSSGTIVLLRNGTEYHRIDSTYSRILLQHNPKLFAERESSLERSWRPVLQRPQPDFSFLGTLDFQNPLMAWPEGIEVDYSTEMTRGDMWFIRERYSLGFFHRAGEFWWGGGIETVSDYMNLQSGIREYYGDSEFSDWGFRISLALPGLRYTLRKAAWPLPEYFWLEAKPGELLRQVMSGTSDLEPRILSQFEEGMDDHASNMLHTLDLRFWVFYYQLTLDGDVYLAPVHRVGLHEMPMGFGQWGAGFLWSGKVAVPELWVESDPFALWRMPPRKDRLWFYPMRLSVAYLDASHYRLQFSMRLRIDDPWRKSPQEPQ